MRLTNYMRDAFVSAAMDDVPAEDFGEQARALLVNAAVSCLPPKVRALYDDPATRDFVCHTQLPGRFNYTYVPGLGALPAGTQEKYGELKEEQKKQDARRRELTDQLRGVAYSARTRKALVALLPEFEKYLPADDSAACKTLPAIANVMADFAKAGWPKDKAAANEPTGEEAA